MLYKTPLLCTQIIEELLAHSDIFIECAKLLNVNNFLCDSLNARPPINEKTTNTTHKLLSEFALLR